MEEDKILQAIKGLEERLLAKIDGLQDDINLLKEDVTTLKENVTTLKEDVTTLKEDVTTLKEDVTKILAFVSVGNEDIVKKLPKLKKAH
jgi:peptidoglycan hydrolase CwlO-like protein